MQSKSWSEHNWIEHTQILLDSYRRWLGQDLISREGDAEVQARRLFEAPFIVVSHGTQPDPVFNYGNRAALELWAMDIETLLRTPSRQTAEPHHQDERTRLLERTARDGYVDDYQGVRVTSRGRQFQIDRATVWNLLNSAGQPIGQAATFSNWHYLDD